MYVYVCMHSTRVLKEVKCYAHIMIKEDDPLVTLIAATATESSAIAVYEII